ncbi:MAG: hypothetical protein ACYSQZ_08210 [Planctomycetota bacterium]|jgi:hypothetical protein
MMKFLSMLPGQKLILARVETPQPPPLPVVAKSAGPTQPFWLAFILWLCAIIGRPLCRLTKEPGHRAGFISVLCAVRTRYTVLAFLATIFISVILENLAQGYIEKMLGA